MRFYLAVFLKKYIITFNCKCTIKRKCEYTFGLKDVFKLNFLLLFYILNFIQAIDFLFKEKGF